MRKLARRSFLQSSLLTTASLGLLPVTGAPNSQVSRAQTAPEIGFPGAGQAPAPNAGANPLYQTSYRVIDAHAHAPLATEAALRAQFGVLDRVGIRAFNVLLFDPAGWIYPGGWSEANLTAWLELRRRFPERVLVFGTVDFGRVAKEPAFFRDIVPKLEADARRGMQGVKIWKNLGMYHRDAAGKLLRIDDPRLDPFWAKCGALGLPVLIHIADPSEYWYPGTYNMLDYQGKFVKYVHNPDYGPDLPSWADLIEQRNRVLKRHPQTQFIGAHFACMTHDFDSLAGALDEYPNLSVDCSSTFRFLFRYHPQAVHDFFVHYQDRILFGSDHFVLKNVLRLYDPNELRLWQERWAIAYSRYLEFLETDHPGLLDPYGFHSEWLRLKGIKLPPPVLEKLYHANAERLIPSFKAA